jgi:secondary thiamine-phosphate synthase enzyme
MQQFQTTIEVATRGQGFYELTREAQRFVFMSGVETGLLTAFCRHTSASLMIQENADPDVRRDLLSFFRRLAPEGMEWVTHDTEGPDDMPAHIKAALTQTSLGIPISGGLPVLGTWQGLYLVEHRAMAHKREVALHLIGDVR